MTGISVTYDAFPMQMITDVYHGTKYDMSETQVEHIELDQDEYITEVIAKQGSFLSKLYFATNKGNEYHFGDGQGFYSSCKLTHDTDKNHAVIGFKGSVGHFLNTLEVVTVDLNEFPHSQVVEYLGGGGSMEMLF